MSLIEEQYSLGSKYNVARLQRSVDTTNSKRRSNLVDLVNAIHKRNGYTIRGRLNSVQHNKDGIMEALNLLLSNPETSAKEHLRQTPSQCLAPNNKSTMRKTQTSKFNGEIITEVDYFKSQRHIIGVKKIRRNYLKEAQDPTLYEFKNRTGGVELADDGLASLGDSKDGTDSLSMQQTTSSTSSNTQPHNCSVASTSSSTITVDGDSILLVITSTQYNFNNSHSVYQSNTENYEGDKMETESNYSISDEEMDAEYYFHDYLCDDLLDSLSNPHNNSITDEFEPMEYFPLNNINNEEMEDSNFSHSEEDQLREEYLQQFGSNRHIVESFIRLMMYTNALIGIISQPQDDSSSS